MIFLIAFGKNGRSVKNPSDPEPVVFGSNELPDDFSAAVLLIDKPIGWSSFGVVKRVRRLVQGRKVGHAGTLDPAASGLLICLVGRATKSMESFMHMTKSYQGVLRLGETTPSLDAETPVIERRPWEHLTPENLDKASKQFVGTIQQKPPMYSAVKVAGERLYKKARRGEWVERKLNTVEVYSFELTNIHGPDVAFSVRCSKGTYIRSLAHDFGQTLGVGAHLVALRRTAIGNYSVENAWTIDALTESLTS